MSIIKKAGAIILSKENPELVALLYRSKQQDWSFPKGHIEEGESIIETTCREITEETGLSVKIISDSLPPMEFDHPKGDHIVVYIFIMQSENDTTIKKEFAGDEIIWINYKEVANKLSYDNIKTYYQQVYAQVEKTINDLNF